MIWEDTGHCSQLRIETIFLASLKQRYVIPNNIKTNNNDFVNNCKCLLTDPDFYTFKFIQAEVNLSDVLLFYWTYFLNYTAALFLLFMYDVHLRKNFCWRWRFMEVKWWILPVPSSSSLCWIYPSYALCTWFISNLCLVLNL